MNKKEIIKKIENEKIIAVVRYNNTEKINNIVKSIVSGGINIIEITTTVPNSVEIIKNLSNIYSDSDVVIGAGTILDEDMAKDAIEAGASFIVSPILNKDIILECNELNILSVPGIATPTEAFNAMQYGAEVLKLFPSNMFSPKIIKTYKGPFPNIKIMPTGGINLDNVRDWIDNGAIAVGIGGELLKNFNGENYEEITNTAKLFREKIL